MRAKLVKETLNEDYYDAHGLNIYNKIADYILGRSDFEGTESERDEARGLYASMIKKSPELSSMVTNAQERGEDSSVRDVLRLAGKIYDTLRETGGLINENMGSQEDIDRENARNAARFDKVDYWVQVAKLMRGELDDFDIDEEERNISIRMQDGNLVDIVQNWEYDGTPTKPLVIFNGNELGRQPIWNDPADTAEDYLEMYWSNRYSESEREEEEEY
jgi:hypothetical protein